MKLHTHKKTSPKNYENAKKCGLWVVAQTLSAYATECRYRRQIQPTMKVPILQHSFSDSTRYVNYPWHGTINYPVLCCSAWAEASYNSKLTKPTGTTHDARRILFYEWWRTTACHSSITERYSSILPACEYCITAVCPLTVQAHKIVLTS